MWGQWLVWGTVLLSGDSDAVWADSYTVMETVILSGGQWFCLGNNDTIWGTGWQWCTVSLTGIPASQGWQWCYSTPGQGWRWCYGNLTGIPASQGWQWCYNNPGRHPRYSTPDRHLRQPEVAVVIQYLWHTSSLARGGSSATVPLADILPSQGWQCYYSTFGRRPP